jgi:hypothetical protein
MVAARERTLDGGTEPVTYLDTIPAALVQWRSSATRAQRTQDGARLGEWLRVRLQLDTVLIIGS